MDNIKTQKVNIVAIVIHDKTEGIYTISLKDEKGGPIINASTFKEAHKKFKEALNLSFTVKNLITFKDAIRDKEKETKERVKNILPLNHKIKYVEVDLPV